MKNIARSTILNMFKLKKEACKSFFNGIIKAETFLSKETDFVTQLSIL